MATKNTALRNKMAQDFGALWNNGTLVIKTSGGTTTLATFTLGSTAFGAPSTGKIAANGVPISATGANNGTAAVAELVSNTGTYMITDLTVGTSAANVIIDNTSIVSGQTVNLTKLEWTESAGTA